MHARDALVALRLPGPAIETLLALLSTYAPKGKHTGLAVFDVMGLRDKSPASKAMDVEIRETTRALEQLERGAGKARELAAAPPAQWTGSIALAEKRPATRMRACVTDHRRGRDRPRCGRARAHARRGTADRGSACGGRRRGDARARG